MCIPVLVFTGVTFYVCPDLWGNQKLPASTLPLDFRWSTSKHVQYDFKIQNNTSSYTNEYDE